MWCGLFWRVWDNLLSFRITTRTSLSGSMHITLHISSYHITSRHVTSHHITSHHITSRHITPTPHHVTSHHITSHHIPDDDRGMQGVACVPDPQSTRL